MKSKTNLNKKKITTIIKSKHQHLQTFAAAVIALMLRFHETFLQDFH